MRGGPNDVSGWRKVTLAGLRLGCMVMWDVQVQLRWLHGRANCRQPACPNRTRCPLSARTSSTPALHSGHLTSPGSALRPFQPYVPTRRALPRA